MVEWFINLPGFVKILIVIFIAHVSGTGFLKNICGKNKSYSTASLDLILFIIIMSVIVIYLAKVILF